jgi:hypothetical protein
VIGRAPLSFKVFEAPDVRPGVKLGEASDVVREFAAWGRAGREVFNVIYLDSQSRVLHVEAHSAGGPDSCGVHPSEIFKVAFSLNATELIVFHNHPSGDPSPSRADKEITASLAALSHLLGLMFLDHIIIGRDSAFYSFQESGLIDDAVNDANSFLGSLSVRDSASESAGCPGCLFWAGDLEFSRFHCWRRVKSGAPAAGEVCGEFWPASLPFEAAPADPELLSIPIPEVEVSRAPAQLSLFGGEK